jgi:hypothetical protein
MYHQKGNISMHSNPLHAPATHDIVTEEEDDIMDDDSNDTPVIGERH